MPSVDERRPVLGVDPIQAGLSDAHHLPLDHYPVTLQNLVAADLRCIRDLQPDRSTRCWIVYHDRAPARQFVSKNESE